MEVYPAIDLRQGRVVRLYQGDYEQMTVYDDDPCAVALRFRQAGARRLHVVDLDGAKDGSMANFAAIAALCGLGGLFIQAGGGIRNEERLRRYLDLGVGRCVMGTAAATDLPLVSRLAARYGPQLAAGVDVRDGMAAIRGWQELSGQPGTDLCRQLLEAGISTIIYTDISRDGALKGTALETYRDLTAMPGLRLIASGGVSSLGEIEALRRMGAAGVILGKALYTGRLDLAQALAAAGDG